MGGRTWYEGRVAIDAGWKGERCTPKHDGDRFIESHYLKSYESNLRKLCERLWVVGREGGGALGMVSAWIFSITKIPKLYRG